MDENLKILIVDALTDETIERDLTSDEIAEITTIRDEIESIEAANQAKATARTSALAKLADLGLTAEEIAAL